MTGMKTNNKNTCHTSISLGDLSRISEVYTFEVVITKEVRTPLILYYSYFNLQKKSKNNHFYFAHMCVISSCKLGKNNYATSAK